MTIYIDLDHTLLNTEALKRALMNALRPLGIRAQQFWSAYRIARRRGPFQTASFVAFLFKDRRTQSHAKRILDAVALRASCFLYPDALTFLRSLRRQKARCILFTYGHRPFQRMKVESIPGYKEFFRRVVITEREDKRIVLPRYKGACAFIDDRPEVLRFYSRRYGIQPLLLCRYCSHTKREHGTLRSYQSLRPIAAALDKMRR